MLHSGATEGVGYVLYRALVNLPGPGRSTAACREIDRSVSARVHQWDNFGNLIKDPMCIILPLLIR